VGFWIRNLGLNKTNKKILPIDKQTLGRKLEKPLFETCGVNA